NSKQHLWMATAVDNFWKMPRAEFERTIDVRVSEKFTHLRVAIDPNADLREAADRIRLINSRGLVADLVLASLPEGREQREQYIADIAARFSPFNLTWMSLPAFEQVRGARAELKDSGALLAKLDAYKHPRTALADITSGALAGDSWVNLLSYGT